MLLPVQANTSETGAAAAGGSGQLSIAAGSQAPSMEPGGGERATAPPALSKGGALPPQRGTPRLMRHSDDPGWRGRTPGAGAGLPAHDLLAAGQACSPSDVQVGPQGFSLF